MTKQSINNIQELINFLINENNSYSEFILSRLNRKSIDLDQQKTQVHHIIPLHQLGPNLQCPRFFYKNRGDLAEISISAKWNLVRLTIEEHAQAHQFLFENYHHTYDLGASKMIRGQVKEGWDTIRKEILQKRKNSKSDRFNSEVQRELGKRPKKQRTCYARNPYIKAALERGFDLYNKQTGTLVKISPCESGHMVDVIDKLMLQPEMEKQKEVWMKYQNKEKYPLLTGLTRVLTGHIDKKTKKGLFSYNNWSVLGINILIE